MAISSGAETALAAAGIDLPASFGLERVVPRLGTWGSMLPLFELPVFGFVLTRRFPPLTYLGWFERPSS